MNKASALSIALSGLLGLCAAQADASCGAGFCTVNSHWDTQGVWTEPGTRLDLRYEYIKQDQLRAGRRTVTAGEIPRDHDEVKTLNRNLLATLDYAHEVWGISLQVPIVDRSHIHVVSATSESETWDIAALGDIRVLGRYQFKSSTSTDAPKTWGVIAGLKLPTGDFEKTNAAGEKAKRTLQPGTGTTDLLAGLYHHRQTLIGGQPVSWFVQGRIQESLKARAGYKPGSQFSFDAGIGYPVAPRWNAMLQLNVFVKHRDSGALAEPEDSGGTFVSLSPGLGHALSRDLRIYGFVQLPLYQYVNGVQLTSDGSVAIGINYRW